jgi:regulator of replication initiation timing
MNEEHDNSLSDDQTIKGIITDLRLVVDQLGKNFMKAKDLIHELARRLDESKRCERDQVSRKIKEILKDEIREGKITAKWIDDCLPPEYKRKYTTKSEDTSLSKENMKEIEVDASGNSEIETAATSDADPNNIVVNYEGRPPDVENLNTHASSVGKNLEEEIKKSTSFATADQQLSEQATVVELKTKIERLQSDLQSKSDENSTLHIQVKDLMSELEANTPHDNQEDKSFDVQFGVPFEDLRRHMQLSFSRNSTVSKVLFTANVDVVNRRLTDIRIGEQQFDSN